MSKENNLKDFLTDIADAVREKKGTTEPINAQNLSEEIRGIESGGDNPWRADVTWINEGEFGFDSMSEVTIHEGVTVIGPRAFRCNSSITKIILPSTLKKIDNYAFSGMTKLAEASIPDGLTTLSSYAFSGSPIIESIIPEGVTRIGYGAYVGCKSLKRVVWKVRGKSENNKLISVASIAFQNCAGLQYVAFPNITGAIILDSANAFSGTTCQIIVPDDVYDDMITATNWSSLASQIVKASEFVEPTE